MESKPSKQYDPSTRLEMGGTYIGYLHKVKQGLTNARYPDGKPLIAFEFVLFSPGNPAVHKKEVSILCPESIYKDPQTGRETFYVKHARQMGVENPLKGFDPHTLKSKFYLLECGESSGRTFVIAANPWTGPNPPTVADVPSNMGENTGTAVPDTDVPF